MKASKFTDAQKAFLIRQGDDGTPVADICRKAGISQATYFNWKKKYAGLMPSEMKRLREKIDEGFEPKLLHTVRGAGYALDDRFAKVEQQ